LGVFWLKSEVSTRIADELEGEQGANELLPQMDANKDANERGLEAENDALPFDSRVLEVDQQRKVKAGCP
jgi:hypothetical protein